MAYNNHKFCWHGIVSTDPDKAAAFYAAVLPWTVMKRPMGGDEVTLFAASGIPRAHLMPSPLAGMPSHWDNYLRVEDVEASTQAASANGGTVLAPPTDIPPGRFSVVTSPSGAALSLFREADPEAQNPPDGDGAIIWIELHSKDLEADLAWLKATFGFATTTMPLPDGGTYYLLKSGDDMVGGTLAAMDPKAPSMWLTWVQVPDVDDAVARVRANGGEAHTEPSDYEGVGRMAVVADSTGAVFGMMTPAHA